VEGLVDLRHADAEVLAFSDVVLVSHNRNISCTRFLCFDRPRLRAAAQRASRRALQFLEANAAKIVFGGPLKNNARRRSTGALYRARLRDPQGCRGLHRADPFTRAGVYESVAIRAFKKVFPRG